MHPQSSSTWVDQGDAVELIFQGLCTMFGTDLANRIIDSEASGNTRPLAGLDPEQLRAVNRQLEVMGIEIRQTLDPEEQVQFEVSLDAAQEIVAAEMREKDRI
jgi:hypothetical protein